MYFERQYFRKFVHGKFLRLIVLNPHRIVGRGRDAWDGREKRFARATKSRVTLQITLQICYVIYIIYLFISKKITYLENIA